MFLKLKSNIIVITLLFIFILFVLWTNFGFIGYQRLPATISEKEYSLLVSDTPLKRQRGLSRTLNLRTNQGMLFVFDKPDTYGFWMPKMNYPIDIIWVDTNKKVVDIVENATPESYPEIFKPKNNAHYVIELNAGQVKEIGLELGNVVKIDV